MSADLAVSPPAIAFARYSPEELAVRTSGVQLRFGAVVSLAGLELAVPRGAVYLLAGTTGAGKSSALHALLDVVRPTGEVELFGEPVSVAGAALTARVGYAAQQTAAAYRRLSAARLFDYLANFYETWDGEHAAQLLRRLDVRADRRIGELSPGQQTLVRLVASLAHRPALLLWDEPTAGLDPIARAQLAELLVEQVAAGAADGSEVTGILSTHLVHEVAPLVDHVGVLHAGRLLAQLPVDDLRAVLRRYRCHRPDGPTALSVVSRREVGRQAEWIVWGEEADVVARLYAAGASHVEASALSVDEAVLAILASTPRPSAAAAA